MSKDVLDAEVLKQWIGGDPYREAILRAEAPVGQSTLSMILRGSYSPSTRLAKAILTVMREHPLERKRARAAT